MEIPYRNISRSKIKQTQFHLFSEGLIIGEQYLVMSMLLNDFIQVSRVSPVSETSLRKTSIDIPDDISFDGSDEIVHIQEVDEQCLQNRHARFMLFCR